jgi:hypothetical protein
MVSVLEPLVLKVQVVAVTVTAVADPLVLFTNLTTQDGTAKVVAVGKDVATATLPW